LLAWLCTSCCDRTEKGRPTCGAPALRWVPEVRWTYGECVSYFQKKIYMHGEVLQKMKMGDLESVATENTGMRKALLCKTKRLINDDSNIISRHAFVDRLKSYYSTCNIDMFIN
jgi:hypothetical protein